MSTDSTKFIFKPKVTSELNNLCIHHIIKTCKIDLSKQKSLITANTIKECKKTWKGKENQFEPRLLCKTYK